MASATYQKILTAAEDYLRSTGSVNFTKSKSNKQIVGALRHKILEGQLTVDVTDGTIVSYLSNAANNDPDSHIYSGGPKGGYWLEEGEKPQAEPKPEDEQSIAGEKGKSVTVSERDLYPLMELWLEKKGYTAKDLSRLKSGGMWGNPDIIGVDRSDLFGGASIEIASCEIKLSDTRWEQYIFEAVSHKRFANRSWFCYRVSSDSIPLAKGMEYYAERFRVGLVQIVLSDAELLDLKSAKQTPLDLIERVHELFPALYEDVPLREQREVVERSGITLTLKF